jgi:hypothetical protein
MHTDRVLTAIVALALLVVAGCHRVEEPGGLLEPVEDGVVAQATFDDSPIEVSDARRAELDRRHGVREEPEPTPEPTPETTPEPTPEPTPAVEILEPIPAEPVVVADDDDSAEPAGEPVAEPVVELEPVVEPEPTPEATPAPTTEELLPPGPASDADAVAALDRIERVEAPPAPEPIIEPEPEPEPEPQPEPEPEPVVEPAPAEEILAPTLRCEGESPLLTTFIRDLELLRSWPEAGKMKAELRDRGGVVYTVQVGDRIGPEGGKVVRIERSEVIVGEIGFSLSGDPDILVKEIRLAR